MKSLTLVKRKKKWFLIAGILFLGLLAILFIIHIKYPFISPQVGSWSVGYSKISESIKDFSVNEKKIITYEFIDSLTPYDTFYIADPFFIRERDTFFLFVELKGESNANIALLTSADGVKFEFDGIVLDEEFHLSYPQVFKYQKEFYMVPEAQGSNQVLLYKAENFPYNWKIRDTLLKNRSYKDPTLLLSTNLNLLVVADDNMKQYIFRADSLNGKWTEFVNYKPRWGNETRPGGRFLNINDQWHLPVQNHSRGYGTGISLYRLEMEEDHISFKKTYPMFLGPQKLKWFNRGMHHMDAQIIDDYFYIVYDGDHNQNQKKSFQYKRSIKLALIDIYNFFTE